MPLRNNIVFLWRMLFSYNLACGVYFRVWKAYCVLLIWPTLWRWLQCSTLVKLLLLLRKIALHFPKKYLFQFCGAKCFDWQEFLKNYSCPEVTPCLHMSALAKWPLSTESCQELIIFLVIVGATCLSTTLEMTNFKDLKYDPDGGQPLFDWDCHQFCFSCREKGRG